MAREKADVNGDNKGNTVLYYVARRGPLGIVKWLVTEERQMISIKNSRDGGMALDVSKRWQQADVFTLSSRLGYL
jgi:hypothetical protein